MMVSQSTKLVTIETRHVHVGEKVRVTGGELDGLVGNVEQIADGSMNIAVRIDSLGCAKVSVDEKYLNIIN